MDRKEFCEKLVETRKQEAVGYTQMANKLKIMSNQLSRIEASQCNFSLTKAIEYLFALGYMITLKKPTCKEFIIVNAEQFVGWLKKVRLPQYSQYALAKAVGCSHVTILHIETMQSKIMIDVFLRIIHVLGYEIVFKNMK